MMMKLHYVVLVVVAVAGCASDASSTQTQAASCDPSAPSACGGPNGGAVCVAHSAGDVPGCEQVGEPANDAPNFGCWACRTDSECTTSAGCLEGSCRQKTGYDFVRPASVQVDDDALGARCCAAGHVSCSAGENGTENCSCLP